MARRPVGWRRETARHSLAARGIRTGQKKYPRVRKARTAVIPESGDVPKGPLTGAPTKTEAVGRSIGSPIKTKVTTASSPDMKVRHTGRSIGAPQEAEPIQVQEEPLAAAVPEPEASSGIGTPPHTRPEQEEPTEGDGGGIDMMGVLHDIVGETMDKSVSMNPVLGDKEGSMGSVSNLVSDMHPLLGSEEKKGDDVGPPPEFVDDEPKVSQRIVIENFSKNETKVAGDRTKKKDDEET